MWEINYFYETLHHENASRNYTLIAINAIDYLFPVQRLQTTAVFWKHRATTVKHLFKWLHTKERVKSQKKIICEEEPVLCAELTQAFRKPSHRWSERAGKNAISQPHSCPDFLSTRRVSYSFLSAFYYLVSSVYNLQLYRLLGAKLTGLHYFQDGKCVFFADFLA